MKNLVTNNINSHLYCLTHLSEMARQHEEFNNYLDYHFLSIASDFVTLERKHKLSIIEQIINIFNKRNVLSEVKRLLTDGLANLA